MKQSKIYIMNLIDNAEDQCDWLSLVPCYTNYIILIDCMKWFAISQRV